SAGTPRSRRETPDLQLLPAAVDQLDPVAVGIPDEAEERAALADAVGFPLGLDAELLQAHERVSEVLRRDRNVPVGGAELVRAAVVVEGQLQLGVVAREGEEVVRGLELPVAHDREVAPELEA